MISSLPAHRGEDNLSVPGLPAKASQAVLRWQRQAAGLCVENAVDSPHWSRPGRTPDVGMSMILDY